MNTKNEKTNGDKKMSNSDQGSEGDGVRGDQGRGRATTTSLGQGQPHGPKQRRCDDANGTVAMMLAEAMAVTRSMARTTARNKASLFPGVASSDGGWVVSE